MKHHLHTLIVLALGIIPVAAQVSPVAARKTSGPVVTERGPHHRVWTRTVEETSPSGQKTARHASYTELATGLHYQKDGQWLEAKEEIEIIQEGAVARQGQHQVYFAANLNTLGAITLVLPDGKLMTSHVLGLAYVDHATGRSAMIAEVKDCVGAVQRPNQVIYRDAFDGDFRASVRYTYTKAGFAQDILVETQPPPPEDYGLAAETTSLEVWTEVVNSPEPTKLSRLVQMAGAGSGQQDENLDFGSMRMGSGRAFSMGQEDLGGSIPVRKIWQKTSEGRQFLIEAVPVPQAKPQLDALPLTAQPNRERQQRIRRMAEAAPTPRQNAAIVRLFPPAPKARPIEKQPMQMASVAAPAKAFVLDYEISGTLNNFTFCGDTNYYVTGPVTLTGTTTIEGGTVIKYDRYIPSYSMLTVTGPIECKTRQYLPAVFTAKDDDTVGEIIGGSTGSPAGNSYGEAALCLDVTGADYDLHDLHIRYIRRGILILHGSSLSLRNAQFGFGDVGLHCYLTSPFTSYLRNVLMHNLTYGFYGLAPYANDCQHLTLHNIGTLVAGGMPALSLQNSLVVSVANGAPAETDTVKVRSSDTGIFQTVGAGAHYLAAGSPFRDCGTTTIDSALLEALKTMTTEPPVVYYPEGCYFSQSLNLFPRTIRDTDTPDLGYHYAPFDYAFGRTYLTDAAIQLHPGTAIATFGDAYYSYGLAIFQGAKLLCEGTPTRPVHIVGFETVQEMVASNWKSAHSVSTPWASTDPRPELQFRFVEWSHLAGGQMHLVSWYYYADTPPVVIRDCAFHSGAFGPCSTFSAPLAVTNCLFDRVNIMLSSLAPPVVFQNNLFHGGYFMVDYITELANAEFYDNLFDKTFLEVWSECVNSHNGYVAESTYGRLSPSSATDQILSNMTFVNGPLGPYYYPSDCPLINAGSRNASEIGLYHYTVKPTNVKEGAETDPKVDIGYHYVALDSAGRPVDTDGDNLFDFLEDRDGDGSFDGLPNGETNWQTSENGTSSSPSLKVFTPLKP